MLSVTIENYKKNYFPSVGNIPLVLRPQGIFPTMGK